MTWTTPLERGSGARLEIAVRCTRSHWANTAASGPSCRVEMPRRIPQPSHQVPGQFKHEDRPAVGISTATFGARLITSSPGIRLVMGGVGAPKPRSHAEPGTGRSVMNLFGAGFF